MEWFIKCMHQYADFKGRARRREYWMFYLFNALFAVGAGFIDGMCDITLFSVVYSLAVLVPGLAVCVRRLHDVGKSGWMYFIAFIPLVGAIWLLVLFCTDSQPCDNQWGPNPKG